MALETIYYDGKEVYSPKYDIMFKAVFTGNDLELLVSFLSGILNMDIPEDGLTIRNSELSKKRKDGKLIFLDIYVTLKNGSHVNVEMQVNIERDMSKRSLFYLSQMMTEQLDESGEYKEICPTIAINILDFDYLDNGAAKYHSIFRMKDVETGIEMPNSNSFEMHFIELKKASKYAKGSMRDLWLKFLSAKTEEEWKMLADKSPIIKKAIDKTIKMSADKDIRFALIAQDKIKRDRISSLANAKREGIAEGVLKIAKAMAAEGIDYMIIAKVTELTIDEVERLQFSEESVTETST